MLARPSGTDLASFLSGSDARAAPLRKNTSGGSPWSGSPTIRLAAPSGISALKRCTFSQSTAARTSKRSSMQSTGWVAIRSMAAASPPRICGPEERVISA